MTGCTHQLHHVLKMWKHFSTSAGQPATKPFQVATGFETPPPARVFVKRVTLIIVFFFRCGKYMLPNVGFILPESETGMNPGVYTSDLYTTNCNLVISMRVYIIGYIFGMFPYPVAITTKHPKMYMFTHMDAMLIICSHKVQRFWSIALNYTTLHTLNNPKP